MISAPSLPQHDDAESYQRQVLGPEATFFELISF